VRFAVHPIIRARELRVRMPASWAGASAGAGAGRASAAPRERAEGTRRRVAGYPRTARELEPGRAIECRGHEGSSHGISPLASTVRSVCNSARSRSTDRHGSSVEMTGRVVLASSAGPSMPNGGRGILPRQTRAPVANRSPSDAARDDPAPQGSCEWSNPAGAPAPSGPVPVPVPDAAPDAGSRTRMTASQQLATLQVDPPRAAQCFGGEDAQSGGE
jgi:hypothetical protein